MVSPFEIITSLQYRLKAALAEVAAFQSGKKYQDMQEGHLKEIRRLEREIAGLRGEVARAQNETVTVRNQWFEVYEDLQKEHCKEMESLQKQLKKMEKRALKAESQRDTAMDKVTELRLRLYAAETELEEEKGKNLKLRAQNNRNYENSSLPSSADLRRKKIPNSREKTGKKPGGQPGHPGHHRKRQEPTEPPIRLFPPAEILEDPDFKKTSKTIIKQLVEIQVNVVVKEYHADIYYNSKTGERVHGEFPAGVVNDVNYGGSIKALLFLLNNDCCTSIDKARKLVSDLTGGKLELSKGMINQLSREFARKSEKERKVLFADLLLSPVMHTDCTNARVNGKNAYVFICASPGAEALYFAREKKGHEGVKGTPAEQYQGILVHDHELTFFRYGGGHQECLAHVRRALKDSMENEPERTWNKEMHSLVGEMLHYRKNLPAEKECDPVKVQEFESRYRDVLKKAKEEYEYIPAGKYYRDGYNLYRRMEEYMECHLLFLHDRRVPATNNEAERLLRGYKRKQKQAVSFRSFESIDDLCQCMSMLIMMRRNEKTNLFQRVSEIFG